MRLRRTGCDRGQRDATRLRCPPPQPSPTCPQPPTKEKEDQTTTSSRVTFLREATRPAKLIVANQLRKAIVECFGATALVQRCQEHKRRNIIEHLPQGLHAGINRSLSDAWMGPNAKLAKKQLLRLAASLEAQHPGAAASLRKGLDETLTVQGLGVTGAPYRTLRTTNPIENLNGSIAHYTRNVKRWKDGQITLRWIASAFSDAAGRFRKLKGHGDMESLLSALERRAPFALQDDELKAA